MRTWRAGTFAVTEQVNQSVPRVTPAEPCAYRYLRDFLYGRNATMNEDAISEWCAHVTIRLDRLLVERGLVTSRERAQGMILAGRVLVNEQKVTKAGVGVAQDAAIRLLGNDLPFVSRGGLKLQGALQHWAIALRDRWCVDIGASTGGFSDCMLQAGAAGVVAVDTGYGQMAVPLRDDPRLRLIERCNARHLEPGSLFAEVRTLAAAQVKADAEILEDFVRPSFLAMDVSFISATLVLAPVIAALSLPAEAPWMGEAVILVKPQFEAGREWIGKGGIVRDPKAHGLAIERVQAAVAALGGQGIEVIDSPITGTEGNREFLLHALFSG